MTLSFAIFQQPLESGVPVAVAARLVLTQGRSVRAIQ